ncbi:MAG: DUF2103 domain-containing protein [Archaeoglobaceae archaeon]
MPKRLRCECGFELESATQYCLNCGKRNAFFCGVFVEDSDVSVAFFGEELEVLKFRRYEDSIRNLYEVVAERIYERRVEDIYVSASRGELIDEAFGELSNTFFVANVYRTDTFATPSEFFERLSRLLVVRKLREFHAPPEEKIQGSHSTVIGGREGYELLLKLAASPYVKKVVPGVIEVGGGGGGVRLKLTRCDERGNIKALLIEGSTVQRIHVITTAGSKEEGEEVLKILSGKVKNNK